MLHDFDSRWAIDFQRHAAKFDPVAELVSFYRPLREDAQGVDVIAPTAELDKYKLVVAPALNVLPQATAEHLIAYVKQGGHLVLGPRSGMKNEYDGLWPIAQPGPLEELLGGRVEEFYALERPVTTTPVVDSGVEGNGYVWAELLQPTKPCDSGDCEVQDQSGKRGMAGRAAGDPDAAGGQGAHYVCRVLARCVDLICADCRVVEGCGCGAVGAQCAGGRGGMRARGRWTAGAGADQPLDGIEAGDAAGGDDGFVEGRECFERGVGEVWGGGLRGN